MSEIRKIYFVDTMTGKKRLFEPLNPPRVTIYSCGPTVYDFPHIGNFRSFMFADVLRRTLKLFGYQVTHVMNITDIDDKIIRGAQAEGIDTKTLAMRYEKAFFEDCRFLRMLPSDHYPRATEHIDDMVALVKALMEKGYTYEKDGSIYFRIKAFNGYGKLSRIDLSQVRVCSRVDSDEYSKEDARDFVLWKGYKPGEPFWETPVGKGRPGWHLECSAMSTRYLGKTLDIHTGAEDLIFPHHENEIAQSEAAFGQEFVRYWMHCAFLNMKKEKMSKSLGNIVTVAKLAQEGFNPLAIRYFLLSVHYRKPLIYSAEAVEAAGAAVERLQRFFQRVSEVADAGVTGKSFSAEETLSRHREVFFEALADDLNTAKALGAVFECVRELNPVIDSGELSSEDARKVVQFLMEVNALLDIFSEETDAISQEIERLIRERQEARKNKDYALADKIRDELKAMGVILEDTRDGVRWRRV